MKLSYANIDGEAGVTCTLIDRREGSCHGIMLHQRYVVLLVEDKKLMVLEINEGGC